MLSRVVGSLYIPSHLAVYTISLVQDGDSEGDSGFVTPDSTTKEKVAPFVEGEDVLSHGKDGLFYLGIIVVVIFSFTYIFCFHF